MLFPPFLQLSRQESSVCQAGDKEEEDCPSSLRPIYYRGGGEDPFSLLGSPFPPTSLYQIIHYEKEEEEGGEAFLRVLSLAGDGRGRQRRAKEAISRQGKSEERDLCQCVLGVVNRSERRERAKRHIHHLGAWRHLKNYCEPNVYVLTSFFKKKFVAVNGESGAKVRMSMRPPLSRDGETLSPPFPSRSAYGSKTGKKERNTHVHTDRNSSKRKGSGGEGKRGRQSHKSGG